MFILRYIIIGMFFLQTQNCEDKNLSKENMTESVSEKINNAFETITLVRYGGMRGQTDTLVITQEKMTYTLKNISMKNAVKKEVETPVEVWSNLNEKYDNEVFVGLEEGETRVVYDGMDDVYTINEIERRNPKYFESEIKSFFEIIEQVRQEFYESSFQEEVNVRSNNNPKTPKLKFEE